MTRLVTPPFLAILILFAAAPAGAAVVRTSDPAVAAAFLAGAEIESFDDLTAKSITSYAAGQTIDPTERFTTRGGSRAPRYNVGGGTFSDPIALPGFPVGIYAPSGPIAGDLRSAPNVAGPVVVTTDEPFNGGFVEVFFPQNASRVGAWITHGEAQLTVLDDQGSGFAAGDSLVAGVAGEFIGIARDEMEIRIATFVPNGGVDAFTIDDFAWSDAAAEFPYENLTFVDLVQDDVDGVEGLLASENVAVSPDGRHVYASGFFDASVAAFERDPATGALTFLEAEFEGVGGVSGLGFAREIVVSPDGANVYVVGETDNAIVGFTRDPTTGLLTFLQTLAGVPGNPSLALAISPDGLNLYATGNDFVNLSRDPATGLVAFREIASDAAGGGVAVAPNGRHVYLVDSRFVVIFDRASDGDLTFQAQLEDDVDVDGLSGVRSVAVSPDGATVYTVGPGDAALAAFARNPVSGLLSLADIEVDGVGGVSGLGQAREVAVAGDGSAVYVTRTGGLVAFSRNPDSGGLRFVEDIPNGLPNALGLSPTGLAASPDGRHVYTASGGENAVVALASAPFAPVGEPLLDNLAGPNRSAVSPDSRHVYAVSTMAGAVCWWALDSATGELAFLGMIQDGVGGADELEQARWVTVSPEGRHVYVGTDDSLTVFARDAVSGGLTFVEDHVDGVAGVDGLEEVTGLVVSGDGNHLYASASLDDTITLFLRDAVSGALTYVESIGYDDGAGCTLDAPLAIALSRDDAHLYVAAATAFLVFERDPADGGLAFADDPECPSATGFQSVAVSNDGTSVYVGTITTDELQTYDRDPGTGTVTAAGGVADGDGAVDGLQQLVAIAIPPSDRYVVAVGNHDHGLAAFARDDAGDLWLAQVEIDPLVFDEILDVDATPNGRHLIFTAPASGLITVFAPELGAGLSGLVALAGWMGFARWGRRARAGRGSGRGASGRRTAG